MPDALLQTLKVRFEQHMHRHKGLAWADVLRRLQGNTAALTSLRRYGRVFVYHNGAQSYYAARGFRGTLNV